MNPLDKVYRADPIKATEKQLDFIIDNLVYLSYERHNAIKKLDKLGKKEAMEIIKEIIEIKNEEEKEFSCSYDPFFYKY